MSSSAIQEWRQQAVMVALNRIPATAAEVAEHLAVLCVADAVPEVLWRDMAPSMVSGILRRLVTQQLVTVEGDKRDTRAGRDTPVYRLLSTDAIIGNGKDLPPMPSLRREREEGVAGVPRHDRKDPQATKPKMADFRNQGSIGALPDAMAGGVIGNVPAPLNSGAAAESRSERVERALDEFAGLVARHRREQEAFMDRLRNLLDWNVA